MSCNEAWEFVMTEPLYVGIDVDGLLPNAKPPGTGDKCKDGHLWHLLPNDPKHTAYCERCPARTNKGRKQATRAKTQPLPPHKEDCVPGRCGPKCKCPTPDAAA
jgi:hypothetical protein